MNETIFPGMPVKTKYGPVGYLLEYRGPEHPAPYVVGIS